MPTPWKTKEIKNESDFEILLRDRSVIAKGVNAETSVSKLLYRRGESSPRIISTFYLAYRNIGMSSIYSRSCLPLLRLPTLLINANVQERGNSLQAHRR